MFWKCILVFIFWDFSTSETVWYHNDDSQNWLHLIDENFYYDNYNDFHISYDDGYDIDCDKIIKNFEKGKRAFDNELLAEKTLVKDGITCSIDEPFSPLFQGVNLLHKHRGHDFTPSLKTLHGIQYILDDYLKKFIGKPKPSQNEIQIYLKKISKCLPVIERCTIDYGSITCNPNKRYRSMDGTCNSITNPFQGASYTPYSRLLDPVYDDNIMTMRKNWKGNDLTSPRRISDIIFSIPMITKLPANQIPNVGFNMFGQLLAHDVAGVVNIHHNSRTGDNNSSRCCSGDYKTILSKSQSHFACKPFSISPDDNYHKLTNLRCHSYIRSQPVFQTDCMLSPAQQASIATGYIDLSIIYGQNMAVSTRNGALLKINKENVLPEFENCDKKSCFYTGDFRSNQTPSLALLHSIFFRFHNLIANKLREMNLMYTDNEIFEEARRINIAIMQHIVFEEYLPILLGGERITCESNYCDYKSDVDGTTTNDFSTSAFRHLHVYCPKNIEFYNEDGKITQSFDLSEVLDDPSSLKTDYDDVVRGLIYQKINLLGYDDEIRNKLFGGIDLLAVDIQRCRDHGLPPYWKYREHCGFGKINSFEDLSPIISRKNIDLLRQVYSSPKDIDVLVGGALEEKGSSLLGPTFKCITKEQFYRYKHGDRFFYTHLFGYLEPFSQAQLEEIKNFSFAKLLCTVTGVTKVPLHAFYIPSSGNRLINCESLRPLNLNPWKHRLYK